MDNGFAYESREGSFSENNPNAYMPLTYRARDPFPPEHGLYVEDDPGLNKPSCVHAPSSDNKTYRNRAPFVLSHHANGGLSMYDVNDFTQSVHVSGDNIAHTEGEAAEMLSDDNVTHNHLHNKKVDTGTKEHTVNTSPHESALLPTRTPSAADRPIQVKRGLQTPFTAAARMTCRANEAINLAIDPCHSILF